MLEVLHNGAEAGLNLYFWLSSILAPRRTVIYVCVGESSFAAPHPFRGPVTEFRFVHLGPHFVEQVLAPEHESGVGCLRPTLGCTAGSQGTITTCTGCSGVPVCATRHRRLCELLMVAKVRDRTIK